MPSRDVYIYLLHAFMNTFLYSLLIIYIKSRIYHYSANSSSLRMLCYKVQDGDKTKMVMSEGGHVANHLMTLVDEDDPHTLCLVLNVPVSDLEISENATWTEILVVHASYVIKNGPMHFLYGAKNIYMIQRILPTSPLYRCFADSMYDK
jgi:ribosome biogenesis protein Nip4